MVNLAAQRIVFMAAESNSIMLAVFGAVYGMCCFCACAATGRNRQTGCLLGMLLLILWGMCVVYRDRGCSSFGSFPPGQM